MVTEIVEVTKLLALVRLQAVGKRYQITDDERIGLNETTHAMLPRNNNNNKRSK